MNSTGIIYRTVTIGHNQIVNPDERLYQYNE